MNNSKINAGTCVNSKRKKINAKRRMGNARQHKILNLDVSLLLTQKQPSQLHHLLHRLHLHLKQHY